MTQTFQKSIANSLISLQNLAASSQIFSTPTNVTANMYAQIFCKYGRNNTTIFTNPLIYRIEGSSQSSSYSGTPEWYELARFTSQLAAANPLVSTPVSGTCSAGQKVVTATTITSFAVQDIIYIKNTTIGNSEWGRIASISGSNITLEENLANAQTGSTIYRGAEYFASGVIDLSTIANLRVVADNSNNANAVDTEVWLSICTSFG